MSGPVRIQRRRTKGWRIPEGAVYVGRPTKWGNPFPVGLHVSIETLNGDKFWNATASDVVFMFKGWISNGACYLEHPVRRDRLLAAIARGELAGKNLACWCPLDQPCHADVLLELANSVTWPFWLGVDLDEDPGVLGVGQDGDHATLG